VSSKDVELIRKRLYLSKKRFKTIYNGAPSVIRKVINKDKEEFIVGFIGTLDTRKQWWIAVEAMIEANKNAQNIILKIAGEGPDTILLKEKISQNPNYYNYLGNISDPINNFYNDVDLIIMTSSLEGLPMVILEAFSLGIPVISTPVGGIPEIVTDGYNGFLIEGNPISFAEKIVYLRKNSSVLDELSKNALSSFAENFTIDKCSENYINTFLSKKNNGK
jgi:glycosyltransferase involved in cell wall biosynthesis